MGLKTKTCIVCGKTCDQKKWSSGPTCKSCYRKAYYIKNREIALERSKQQRIRLGNQYTDYLHRYYQDNREKLLAQKRDYQREHLATFRERNKAYRQKNLERMRATGLASVRRRKLTEQRNCPLWLTPEQIQEMKSFYSNRPVGFHVDHIIPLRGKDVCGLHVPWNLQYLPAIENLKKGNRYGS